MSKIEKLYSFKSICQDGLIKKTLEKCVIMYYYFTCIYSSSSYIAYYKLSKYFLSLFINLLLVIL